MAVDPTIFGTPLYVDAEPDPVFAILHEPRGAASPLAVVFCPPFGWDDIASYRPRRVWAQTLADAGHPALRFDLPGSGDSAGGPRDPQRLEAWTAGVAAAAAWLRDHTGSHRIVAIGSGLGGMLAVKAASEGAPIDDFVLWGVPARGKTLLRELRAFARMESAGRVEPEEEHDLAEGGLEVAGFLLSEETAADLSELDLTALELAEPGRRALLLDREGIEVDGRLREHLQESGVETRVSPGPGYSRYLEEPQQALPPREAFATVQAWLDEAGDAPSRIAQGDVPATLEQLELPPGEPRVRETPVVVERPEGLLLGVLAEPIGDRRADLCAVILNPGALRRVGSGRVWVDIARRWAGRGVPTLRLDIAGIGDSDGDAERYSETASLYGDELVPQVSDALDALERRGLPSRFLVMGLCSGAFWALHAAVRDPRVVATYPVNIRALFWDPSLEAARDARKARWALEGSRWRRVLTGKVPLRELVRVARAALLAPVSLARQAVRRRQTRNRIEGALDRLRDTDQRLLFVFGDDEPVYDELARDGYLGGMGTRWPNAEVRRLPGNNHTFRPLGAQRRFHDLLDEELERELAVSGDAGTGQPARRTVSGS